MAEHDFCIDRVIVHAPYMINLGQRHKTGNGTVWCQDFLSQELERVVQIGAKTLSATSRKPCRAGMEVGIVWIQQGLK